MLPDQHKSETNQVDLPPNFTPPYPAWVKEFINREIDAAIARAKRTGTARGIKDGQPVKPKPS
jgi:hypothetical protein